MFYIIYTDRVGGSFVKYCSDIDSMTKFIKDLSDKYTITAITEPQENNYMIYTDGKGGLFSEYCKDVDSIVKFVKKSDAKYKIIEILNSSVK